MDLIEPEDFLGDRSKSRSKRIKETKGKERYALNRDEILKRRHEARDNNKATSPF